jgi:transposase
MEELLTMSKKEISRLKILEQIKKKKLTVNEATESLGISERQTYRILKRYREEGDQGLVHRSRGKPSNRGYPEELKEKVIRIYRRSYKDFGPTFFTEKLEEREDIKIDHETVRRWLRSKGEITSTRRSRGHRKKRERKTSIGAMLQFDGSHHDWFEGRGDICCLLVAIDDASSKVFLRFAKSENTLAVLKILREYVEKNGIPHSTYTDKYGVYYAEKEKTDFQLAMKKLSVRCIYANSPQAKGRVERSNRTLQDRLVKEMRLMGISDIDEANKFLKDSFIEDYNKRFSHTKGLPDIHLELNSENLDNIFCHETKRQVRNDYTISLSGNYIQLDKSEVPLPIPKQYVILRKYLDGSLHIFNNDNQPLEFTELSSKPKVKIKEIRKAPSNHPWRKMKIGKAKYA